MSRMALGNYMLVRMKNDLVNRYQAITQTTASIEQQMLLISIENKIIDLQLISVGYCFDGMILPSALWFEI